ncbi:hypothetical protein Tco_0865814 [Tanacetum coccineum]
MRGRYSFRKELLNRSQVVIVLVGNRFIHHLAFPFKVKGKAINMTWSLDTSDEWNKSMNLAMPALEVLSTHGNRTMDFFDLWKLGSPLDAVDKVNQETKTVNESLTAELERYKERVKTFEQRLNVDLSSHEKLIDSQMDDMIRNRNALKQEIDSLK